MIGTGQRSYINGAGNPVTQSLNNNFEFLQSAIDFNFESNGISNGKGKNYIVKLKKVYYQPYWTTTVAGMGNQTSNRNAVIVTALTPLRQPFSGFVSPIYNSLIPLYNSGTMLAMDTRGSYNFQINAMGSTTNMLYGGTNLNLDSKEMDLDLFWPFTDIFMTGYIFLTGFGGDTVNTGHWMMNGAIEFEYELIDSFKFAKIREDYLSKWGSQVQGVFAM